MSKFYTVVKVLSLLALLASPSAFAGRDSGGNGDSKIMGNTGGDNPQGNSRDLCKEAARTTDELRMCEQKFAEDLE